MVSKRFAHTALLLFGILATASFTASAQVPSAKPLTGCAGDSPPFVMTKKGVGFSGFSFELFQDLARQIGQLSEVKDLPWARCLDEVKAGRIDVAIDAYEDADRRKVYHYSVPYYTLTPQIFYLASTPKPLFPVKSVQALATLKGCGVFEYTYEHYDLDATKLDLGATGDLQMLQKLKAGRCDYAVEELEYIIGGRNYDPAWLDETGISSFRPSWARGPSVHLLVGKTRPDGAELIAKLNSAITKNAKNGFTKALQKRYFHSAANPATK
jgi:polar amino acid transport system substrate-binding protein